MIIGWTEVLVADNGDFKGSWPKGGSEWKMTSVYKAARR